jgi:hypothetical protein
MGKNMNGKAKACGRVLVSGVVFYSALLGVETASANIV